MANQFRQDDETTVGPAPSLNDERAEIRRRRAERQPLRVIVELPPTIDEIHGRLRVFDHGPVLNELADRIAALDFDNGDVFERALAGQRVRTDPERRSIVGEPLMDDELNIRGGTGDPLESSRSPGERVV